MEASFPYFNLEFNAGITHLAWVSYERDRHLGALNKSILLQNSKVKYKTICYWTLSLVSPSPALLKVHFDILNFI